MKFKTSIAISVVIHAAVLIYLIVPSRATYTPPKQSAITVNLTEMFPEEEKPTPKPDRDLKDDKDKVRMQQTVLPTPKPTKTPTPKPTKTPTKKPTATPTKKPTKKPTPKPTSTPVPTKTQTPKPSPTPEPSPTPTPENKVSFDDLLNKLQTPTAVPTFDYSPAKDFTDMFPKMPGTSDSDKNAYGAKLSNWLQKHWRQPRTIPMEDRDYTTVISFVIDKKGQVSGAKILTQSGWALMDQTVEDAIKEANPVPPLPPTFMSSSIEVRVPFLLKKK